MHMYRGIGIGLRSGMAAKFSQHFWQAHIAVIVNVIVLYRL